MRVEKHGRGVEQARRMLDTFASLAVNGFDVTETDIDGHKQAFRRDQRVEQLRRWMPHLMALAMEHQRNIIVRPKGATVGWVPPERSGGQVHGGRTKNRGRQTGQPKKS